MEDVGQFKKLSMALGNNGHKLHTLEVAQRLFEIFANQLNFNLYISFMVILKMPRKLILCRFQVTVKLLYMEVLLVSKNLAVPKTVRVTAKVSSFDPL